MKSKFILSVIVLLGISCTDLNEELRDTLTESQATELIDPADLLSAVYAGMHSPYSDQARLWALQEHTSDEVIGPTRGPDWDDNGIWRSLHNHSWDATHDYVTQTFSELLQIVFNTTNLLEFNPSSEQAAEARFIRAFAIYSVVDGWGQVPFRDDPKQLLADARVMQAEEAVQYIIDEVNAVMDDLPDGPASRANKDAAKVLLMKTYLNKGTFLNRTSPTFDSGDMQQVSDLADEIIASGKYSNDNYFENFAPNNGQVSTDNIFTFENVAGVGRGSGNNVRSRWFCTLHYNTNPSGWNGFATIGDFYDKFEDSDLRKGGEYPGVTDVSGLNVGFLEGQQFDVDGNPLSDRSGAPLAFTKEVALQESGSNLEVTGIRVIKYPIDYTSGDNIDNDLVFYRYTDVLLMKAEALLRTNNGGMALTMVNDLRAKRGASALSSLSLDDMIDERGREFYWEGQRRSDLIRFGKFQDAWNEKPASGPERLLFPIPANSLASNPNLVQNTGY